MPMVTGIDSTPRNPVVTLSAQEHPGGNDEHIDDVNAQIHDQEGEESAP